jgi:hypothetical protein
VGSFLVPVTIVAFALSRRREGFLTIEQIALAFLAAGTLGVLAAASLEIYLLPRRRERSSRRSVTSRGRPCSAARCSRAPGTARSE